MTPVKTTQEGVIAIFNAESDIIGIVRKDLVSRKNVLYSVSEMGFGEISELLEGKILEDKIKNEKSNTE